MSETSAEGYTYSPDGRLAWTKDELHEYELQSDGTYAYAGPGPATLRASAVGSRNAPSAKAVLAGELRASETDAARPGLTEEPSTSNAPIVRVTGDLFSWSRGSSKNYLALASAISAAISLVLISLVGAVITGALALFADRWAVANDGIGRRLADLALLVAILTMVISNFVTSDLF